jgi:hypothetical protein
METHTFILKENFNPFTFMSIPMHHPAMVTTNILLCKMWKITMVQLPCASDIMVLYGFVNSSCRWHLKTSEGAFNSSMAMNVVAHRPVATQRPQKGQPVQPLLCNSTHFYAAVKVLLGI